MKMKKAYIVVEKSAWSTEDEISYIHKLVERVTLREK